MRSWLGQEQQEEESLEQEGMWSSHEDPWGWWKEQLRRALITYCDLTGPVQCLHPVLQVLLVTGLQEIPLGQSVDNCREGKDKESWQQPGLVGLGSPQSPPPPQPLTKAERSFGLLFGGGNADLRQSKSGKN